VRALPGVEHAGVGFSLPIDGSNWNSVFWPQDKPLPPTHDGLPRSAMVPITAGYLEALGIRTVRGRAFDARDTGRSTPVTIVNETLASHIWPGQDPIGKHVKQGWPESPGDWREVVGVVADVRFEGVTEPATMQMYLPMEQDPSNEFFLAVRAAVDPASLAAGVGEIVGSVNRDMPIAGMKTMEQVLGESLARQRMALLVLSVFAMVALVLASVGLYGVVSHSVTERRHEIGVRLALGAARRDVVRLVVGNGMSMAAAGAAVGLVAAAFVTKALTGLLFGVEPLDPLTFALVAVLLLVVAAVACSVPAWRATRLGITTALRAD
jgi:putative ABC transport system permease protein